MSGDEETPDLFPEVPSAKSKRVSQSELLTLELNAIRQEFMVTTPHIAERTGVPVRTLESYVCGRRLPAEWVSKLLLEKLRQFFPRR